MLKWCSVFLLTIIGTVRCDDAVFVDLNCGRVKGSKTNTSVGNVSEFHQIPYAVPPVGTRRWTHSVLLDSSGAENCWEGEDYNASAQHDPPIKCVQSAYWADPSGREDCLHLSVRTPSLDPTSPLPVLVWIHGGSLMGGWSDQDGYAPTAEFTADLNVVTVNINYRLDLMGFFSVPEIWNDPENPGNYGNFGIGDAITALKWVRANIAKFGGDPNSVTVMGESSGGTITLGLLVADQADGLFNKAIALSAPAKWVSTYKDAYAKRKSFVSDVGCTQETEAKRRDCLRSLDLKRLINHVDTNRGWGFYDFPLGSGNNGESMDYNVLEPTLIKVSPTDLSSSTVNKHTTPVKLILSNTAQETGYNALYYSTNLVETWQDASFLLTNKLENLENLTDFNVCIAGLQSSIEKIYNFDMTREGKWWPQMSFDTLTTDIRTTCITNDLTEDLNKNPLYDVRRLYVESRPDEVIVATNSVSLLYETIHGWDTEALFGYGWFGLGSSTQRHQRKFRDNLRDMVHYICYDKKIEGWDANTTLVMANEDFPFAVRVEKDMPQKAECSFWRNKKMLGWGWQN